MANFKPTTHDLGMPLDDMSVDELEARAELLIYEIARIKENIKSKQVSKDKANDVFKSVFPKLSNPDV